MNEVKLAKIFYQMEINDYYTYTKISEVIKDEKLKEKILKIAQIEKKHASFWKDFLKRREEKVPEVKISKVKETLMKFLSKFINPILVISFFELGESGAIKRYYNFLKKGKISEEERKELKSIILDEIEHETFFARQINKKGLENVRDFVLGMNDGIVEILGAVAGLSAVYLYKPFMVGVSGLIVGVAGALSMGIGAFISVRSQRQVNQAQKELMEIIFDVAPERAIDEYKQKLIESGIVKDIAEEISLKLGLNKEAISKLLIEESEENELKSGLFTGFAYLVGVFFPVIPYFFAPNSYIALPFSIIFAGLALTIVATLISILSGISIKKKVIEMVSSAFTAAAIAYTFGSIMQNLFGIEI